MDARSLYLEVMKLALTDLLYENVDAQIRRDGRDWPSRAYTMIGIKRLSNLQHCIEEVLRNEVAGDLIETGVWRGGATIFMRAVLKVDNVTNRQVWVADSFEGLPRPDPDQYPADLGNVLHQNRELAITMDEVKANFERFHLLDAQVCFIKGWFRDTLPVSPVKQLAILRLDGDLYESTMVALKHLYPKLSVGGYVIVDDYGAIAACQKAVDDYRTEQGIDSELTWIDWTGVYWQRQ